MAINSLKSVHTRTNTPFFLMLCYHMHFCVESLLHSASPSLFLFLFITPLCAIAFVNISPLNLSVNFDRGLFISGLIPKEENVKHCIHY